MVGSKVLVDFPHLGLLLKYNLFPLFFFVFRLYPGFPCFSFFIRCYLLLQLFLAACHPHVPGVSLAAGGLFLFFFIAAGDKAQRKHTLGNVSSKSLIELEKII